MRSLLTARRLRTKAVMALAAVSMAVLAVPSATVAHADTPPTTPTIPTFTDGYGLTQVADPSDASGPSVVETPTNFTITVTTPEVANDPAAGTVGHHIRIILPSDYYTNTTERYPVLYYLLGAGDDPVVEGNLQSYLSTKMITVIPDGGPRGWYVNWLNQETAAGAQNWETFEIDQVIPFIDANLRTIPDKADRAIAGLSMGGFGAFHLAEAHPSLFSNVASLSGPIDMSEDDLATRVAVVAMETNIGQGLVSSGGPALLPNYGPDVPADAIFGPIAAPADTYWSGVDPSSTANLTNLTGMGISIYTGSGKNSFGIPDDVLEPFVESAAGWTEGRLNAAGIPSYYVDYGDGAGWGTAENCTGGHTYPCWDADLQDYIPRLETAFGLSTVAMGAVTGYQGLCLDVRGGGVAPGTAVQVYGCNGTSAQFWTVGSGNTVKAYGECLDVSGGGTWDGTGVDLYTCNGTGAQQWIPQADGALLNPQSGKCLDDTGWGGAGTQAQIWDCTGAANQDWNLPSRS